VTYRGALGPVDGGAHALGLTLNAEHAAHALVAGSVTLRFCGFAGQPCGCSLAAGAARELTVGGERWTWADDADGSARCISPSQACNSTQVKCTTHKLTYFLPNDLEKRHCPPLCTLLI
jgi:hypothetical protein